MPELPEVECLKRGVKKAIQGKKLKEIRFFREDLRYPIPIKKIKRECQGESINSVKRRSKYLLWEMDRFSLVIHLGMTGNLIKMNSRQPALHHTHAIFTFIDSSSDSTEKEIYLHYIDPRRFGMIDLCKNDELSGYSFFVKLGVEPLQKRNLGEYLFMQTRRSSRSIKTFIMDASIVVGVGNIYACEALFRAGIHPGREANSLSQEECIILGSQIKDTLKDAIKAGGTSFRDYRDAEGNPGYFELSLSVYGRVGEKCYSCGKIIKANKISGRTSFYCDNCQN